MKRWLAYVLTLLLLLQSFGRELLVLHFKAHQAALAARYCVNKARPRLRCDGRCYLARQLRRAERGPAKAPGTAWAKLKFEVVAPVRLLVGQPVWASPRAPQRYAHLPAPACRPAARGGTFHPPAAQG